MCHELSSRLAWAWARRSARRHTPDVDEPEQEPEQSDREARRQEGAEAINAWLGEQAEQE